ncbi:MAG TPA: hypothetical protein PKD86_12595 [Gemmatales bacterium]|nr:hypothetical protein [Gemmatales bacterium]HMP60181.1 hypothetical protein [Gemmatales bacterium]
MRLYAAIVTQPTNQPKTTALQGLDKAKSKIEELEKKIDAAWQAITIRRQADPVFDEEQFVFLAPEYFFSNQQHAQDRFFSQNVKRYVIAKLAALAKKYPKLLIIPGTVLWTKNAYEETVQIGKRQMAAPLQNNQGRINRAKARIQESQKAFPKTNGFAQNRQDWTHSGPLNGLGLESSTNVQEKYLNDADYYQTRIAQNVAYVCLGQKIVKYHKVGNYKEVNGEQGTIVFEPGKLRGRFKIGDVRYALEVCMDHALGVVTSDIGGSDDQPHVRIIVSDTTDNKPRTDDVVLLHSSTYKAGTYSTPNGPIQLKTDPVVLGGGCKLIHTKPVDPTLTLYTVQIDNKPHGINRKNTYVLSDTQLPEPKHVYAHMA